MNEKEYGTVIARAKVECAIHNLINIAWALDNKEDKALEVIVAKLCKLQQSLNSKIKLEVEE